MKKKLLKYGILSFFGIAMIYQFIPIGDYCRGLLNGLNLLFFGGLLILTFLIITIRSLLKLFKQKKQFDFIPFFLIIFFGVCTYLIIGLENEKFWTKRILVGIIEVYGTPKSGTLTLYKNGSFGATYHKADYSCTFQGNYEIKNDTLLLKRKNLNELTEKTFTTEYIIDRKNNILKPKNKDFKIVEITTLTE
ncbi:hypothetical protein [Tenacibaculum aestuarii]|uniref:hypothetical protein n=1 Tax=Tenacibaculum aestuarii TaxID=362781 RepID=UPI003893C8F2